MSTYKKILKIFFLNILYFFFKFSCLLSNPRPNFPSDVFCLQIRPRSRNEGRPPTNPLKASFKTKYSRPVKGMIYLNSSTNIYRVGRGLKGWRKRVREAGRRTSKEKSKSGLLQLIASKGSRSKSWQSRRDFWMDRNSDMGTFLLNRA